MGISAIVINERFIKLLREKIPGMGSGITCMYFFDITRFFIMLLFTVNNTCIQGRTQEVADGAKAPPEIPR